VGADEGARRRGEDLLHTADVVGILMGEDDVGDVPGRKALRLDRPPERRKVARVAGVDQGEVALSHRSTGFITKSPLRTMRWAAFRAIFICSASLFWHKNPVLYYITSRWKNKPCSP